MSSSSETEDKLSSFDGDEEEDPTLSTIPTVSSPSMLEEKPSSTNYNEKKEEPIEEEEEDGDVEEVPRLEWSTEIETSLTPGNTSLLAPWDPYFLLISSKRYVLLFIFHFLVI